MLQWFSDMSTLVKRGQDGGDNNCGRKTIRGRWLSIYLIVVLRVEGAAPFHTVSDSLPHFFFVLILISTSLAPLVASLLVLCR